MSLAVACDQGLASIVPILSQMYHLATAKACVVDGYVIPVSLLRHRPGQLVIQLWHALGAIKRFGYQTLDRPGGHSSVLASSMRMHRNYNGAVQGLMEDRWSRESPWWPG